MSNHSRKYFKLHGILDWVCFNHDLNDLKVANSILRDADNKPPFRICFMNIRQWSFLPWEKRQGTYPKDKRIPHNSMIIYSIYCVELKDVTYIPYLSTKTHGFFSRTYEVFYKCRSQSVIISMSLMNYCPWQSRYSRS